MSGSAKLLTPGGGGVALTPASSIASDVTVNVPSSNGTLVSTGETAQVSQAMLASGVAGNGPAFSVNRNSVNQSISAGTWTKVQFTTEEFDTNSNFDNNTNYRFTPTVAGYYSLTGNVWMGGQISQRAAVWKNGSSYKVGPATSAGGGYMSSSGVSCIVYLNGSTDYVELYAYQNSGSQTIDGAPTDTYFSGALVRAA